MRTGQIIASLAAIACVPVGSLVLLCLMGLIGVWPAALAIGATCVSSLVLSVIWVRDIELLGETLRQAALENAAALAVVAAAPRLPAVERITRNIERLSRTLASRAAMVGQLLKTNEVIVDRLPDPLLVLGADRAVRRANAAARQAFGADMPAVLRHPDLRGAIDRAFANRTTQATQLALPVPVPREVAATVIFMDPPLADGGQAIVVLSDRSRDRAVERMRADFVANASHELRTPLASLIGFIDTLRGPAKDDVPAQTRFLAIMAEQAERMSRLIDDLLSLSRIELTEHQAPSERVDLGGVVERIAAGFEPRVMMRNIRLDLALTADLPMIPADPDQLEQVLTNLIDNALKYGRDEGFIRVSVAAAVPGGRWPSRPGQLLVVSDNGRGIAREHLPRLTERFYRVDKGRSRNAAGSPGGTGLGLAIVKHIVNRHRGQLVIESEEGQGSTFSVWLPLAADKTGERA
jgi:two-component system, OmpR family, phosphate regulon sensor histidine kinase PhoR